MKMLDRRMVELSNGGRMELSYRRMIWNGGVVESSNGGIVEWSIGVIMELSNG